MHLPLQSAYKRFGLLGLFENVCIHVLDKLGVKFSLMELYSRPVKFCLEKQNTDVIVLTPEIFRMQKLMNPTWFTEQKISDMMQAFEDTNNVALGVLVDDLLVSYGWLSVGKMGLDNIPLATNDGYLWDDYTHPDYRGKGLHSKINVARLNYLANINKTRALTQVAHYNRASRKGYLKDGFTLMERFAVLSFGRFNYSSIKYKY